MAEWRVGPLDRTLYRDGELVGEVETRELASEIVETMNRVGRLLDEVRRHNDVDGFQEFLRETARERSRAGELPPGAVWVEPGRSFAMNASSEPTRIGSGEEP